MTDIHQTTIVDENAKIGQNVSIGPYSAIGPEVELGDGIDAVGQARGLAAATASRRYPLVPQNRTARNAIFPTIFYFSYFWYNPPAIPDYQ